MNQRDFLKELKLHAPKFSWYVEPVFGMLRGIPRRKTTKVCKLCPIEAVAVARKVSQARNAYWSTDAPKLKMQNSVMNRIIHAADEMRDGQHQTLRYKLLKAVGMEG